MYMSFSFIVIDAFNSRSVETNYFEDLLELWNAGREGIPITAMQF